MDPFEAGAALHQPVPSGHIFSAHWTGKDRARVRMNVGAYQEKEKNEKTGKRETERRKQSINFKKAACCPSVVVHGAIPQKNGLCKEVHKVTGTLRKANSHLTQPKWGQELHHHVEAAVA